MQLAPRHHHLIRFLAAAVTVGSITYMASRAQLRADVTAEGLSRLTPETEALIAGITSERPVTVHAFVSKEVPRDYVPVRMRLLNILREMEAQGGEGLQVRIVEPEVFSTEADEAIDNYGIQPRQVFNREGGRVAEMNVFLGLAFVSGPREEVVPFLDRGLSVEYEVARALEVVTQDKKKVIGIPNTDAHLMGNFDLQARRQQPAWRIIEELRKQYEVRSLNPGAKVPEDVDVLFVPQVSSLTQEELEFVKEYIDAGRPALLSVDPMPLFDLRLAPSEPRLPPPGQQNMFGGGGGEPKGDYRGFLSHIGVTWDDSKIVYDDYNPHPSFSDMPPHVVFVGKRPGGFDPFSGEADPTVQGLSEVVVLFAGELRPDSGKESSFAPLLRTGQDTSGYHVFDDMVQRHMLFGLQGPAIPRKLNKVAQSQVMAAKVNTTTEEGKPRNVVVLADLDMFGDQFFNLHEKGGDIDGDGLDDIRFDNVPFLLNLVDSLAGDERFVALRKRKPEYRRLERVDELTREARAERERELESAGAEADKQLEEAQKALDAAVETIRSKTDLDETTKAIMLKSAEEAENRRLEAKRERIERDKARTIAKIEANHKRKVDEVQNGIRLLAVLVPPIPALVLGGFIFARKRRRERETIPQSRRRSGAGGSPPPSDAASAKGGAA